MFSQQPVVQPGAHSSAFQVAAPHLLGRAADKRTLSLNDLGPSASSTCSGSIYDQDGEAKLVPRETEDRQLAKLWPDVKFGPFTKLTLLILVGFFLWTMQSCRVWSDRSATLVGPQLFNKRLWWWIFDSLPGGHQSVHQRQRGKWSYKILWTHDRIRRSLLVFGNYTESSSSLLLSLSLLHFFSIWLVCINTLLLRDKQRLDSSGLVAPGGFFSTWGKPKSPPPMKGTQLENSTCIQSVKAAPSLSFSTLKQCLEKHLLGSGWRGSAGASQQFHGKGRVTHWSSRQFNAMQFNST